MLGTQHYLLIFYGRIKKTDYHRGLRRGGLSGVNRLKPNGVPLWARGGKDPGTTAINTSGPLSAPPRTEAGTVCY